MQPGTIDDFMPNWSVVSQIQDIKQFMMLAEEEAESKGQTIEVKDASEKENRCSEQHEATPEAVPAAQAEPNDRALSHLHITEDPEPVHHAVFHHHEDVPEPRHQAGSTGCEDAPSAQVIAYEPEADLLQVSSLSLSHHLFCTGAVYVLLYTESMFC
jgi:hypothetical protein